MAHMRKIDWRKYSPLLFMLVFPLLGLMYAWTNAPKPNREVHQLVTTIDQSIPFVHGFALPYSIWIFYIYVCLIYFFKKDANVYYRALTTYVLCALTCYFIYSVFQTTVPRPIVTGDGPLSDLMRYIYERDRPFNCFPSIHCFSSYMVMRLIWSSPFRNKLNLTLITGMSCLIILSTLFVKQHVIMDALAAFMLVEIVLAVIYAAERRFKGVRQRENGTFGA